MIGTEGAWPDLVRGAGLGLAVAAPIGPTGMLCIQRTLAGGALVGMATGYGVATMHMAHAAVAATGLLVLAEGLAPPWIALLQVACAAFLLRLAVQAVRRAPRLAAGARQQRPMSPAGAYAFGLVWTLGNPLTVLGFAALSPSFLGVGAHAADALPELVAGVFIGSATWWTVLALGVALARRQLSERGLRLINLATGVVLALSAAGVLARAAWLS